MAINIAKLQAEIAMNFAPTAQQAQIITCSLCPLLVVAGAGAGKTTTLADRVAYQIIKGHVLPHQVLGLTFTKKAAGELAERINHTLQRVKATGKSTSSFLDLDQPEISTYDSFVTKMVQDNALILGKPSTGRMLSKTSAWQLAYDLVKYDYPNLAIYNNDNKRITNAEIADKVLSLSASVQDNLLSTITLADQIAPFVEALAENDSGYKQKIRQRFENTQIILSLVQDFLTKKAQLGYEDFSDRLYQAVQISNNTEVVAKVQSQYKLILLDEFQDTSVAQSILFSNLFKDCAVTAVGDPNQAIYGFRGASAAALADFAKYFSSKGHDGVKYLEINTAWRNDEKILQAANAIAAPLRQALSLSDSKISVAKIAVAPNKIGQGSVQVAVGIDEEEEHELIVDYLKQHLKSDTSAAILCRNKAKIRKLYQVLLEQEIPVYLDMRDGLLETTEVSLLRAYLQVVNFSDNPLYAWKILQDQDIPMSDLEILSAYIAKKQEEISDSYNVANNKFTWTDVIFAVHENEVTDISVMAQEKIKILAKSIIRSRKDISLPLPLMIRKAAEYLNLNVELTIRAGQAGALSGTALLDAFTHLASEYKTGNPYATLDGFLAWIDAAQVKERGLEIPVNSQDVQKYGVVTIMTVHGAKGLEWDIVIVPGILEGKFPSYPHRLPNAQYMIYSSAWLYDPGILPYQFRGDKYSIPQLDESLLRGGQQAKTVFKDITKPELEIYRCRLGEHEVMEERRIAYVAFTRPRNKILLTASRRQGENKTLSRVSRFMSEIYPLTDTLSNISFDEFIEHEVDTYHDFYFDLKHEVLRSRNTQNDYSYVTSYKAIAPQLTSDELPKTKVNLCQQEHPLLTENGRSRRDFAQQVQNHMSAYTKDTKLINLGVEKLTTEINLMETLLAERKYNQQAIEIEVGQHLSASAIVRILKDPQQWVLNIRRPIPAKPVIHAIRGTQAHEWVAQQYGYQLPLDIEIEDAHDDDIDITQLSAAFNSDANPWRALAAEAVEQRVYAMLIGKPVVCTIDAIFQVKNKWHIVDWKTGKMPKDEQEIAIRSAQIALYKYGWSREKQVPIEQIETYFCYLGETDLEGNPTARVIKVETISIEELEIKVKEKLDSIRGV